MIKTYAKSFEELKKMCSNDNVFVDVDQEWDMLPNDVTEGFLAELEEAAFEWNWGAAPFPFM